MHAEKIPTTAEKLDRAPRRQCGLVSITRRIGLPTGRNAIELETLEPSVVSEAWP